MLNNSLPQLLSEPMSEKALLKKNNSDIIFSPDFYYTVSRWQQQVLLGHQLFPPVDRYNISLAIPLFKIHSTINIYLTHSPQMGPKNACVGHFFEMGIEFLFKFYIISTVFKFFFAQVFRL